MRQFAWSRIAYRKRIRVSETGYDYGVEIVVPEKLPGKPMNLLAYGVIVNRKSTKYHEESGWEVVCFCTTLSRPNIAMISAPDRQVAGGDTSFVWYGWTGRFSWSRWVVKTPIQLYRNSQYKFVPLRAGCGAGCGAGCVN